jgi:hypothetical protein
VIEIEDRHRELLRTLAGAEVQFVLVGGVALQLRGFSGATRDVDVTIAVDDLNTRRLDLTGERGVAYRTRLGQIEVMRWTDGVGDYDAWTREATMIELEPGLDVWVGSASHLLLSKEDAGREKDADALPLIRAELLASGALQEGDVRGPVASLPTEVTSDPRVEQVLGPRPGQRRKRGLWDHGAQLIAEYRERWSVPDDDPLLGTPPAVGGPQAADREALDQQLERLRRLIARTSKPRS